MDDVDKPMSMDELKRILRGRANVYTYPEIKRFKTIDELLNPYGSAVILYLTSSNYGHYTCINKIKPDEIEFFDSYSIFPDKELNTITKQERIQLDQSTNHISKLMKESQYKLSYNHHKFQSKNTNVSTCGKHCIMRIYFKHLSLRKFNGMMRKKMKETKLKPDEIVSIFVKELKQHLNIN